MNIEMAYMLGMILGNGEIQQNATETTVTIDIPYKNDIILKIILIIKNTFFITIVYHNN